MEERKATKSGIVLPDNVEKKEQTKGTVTAVGPGKLNENGTRSPMSVKFGDTILFSKPWSDDKKVEEGEKKYFIVSEDDILAIIQ